MSLKNIRLKTDLKNFQSPFKKIKDASQNCISKTNITKQSFQSKINSSRSLITHPHQRAIKEENHRLVTKIMEITHRKAKPILNQLTLPRRKQFSKRERQISIENQRLGSTLVRIKSGKNIESVKVDIAKSIAKLARRKKKLEKLITIHNNPQQILNSHKNIGLISISQHSQQKYKQLDKSNNILFKK